MRKYFKIPDLDWYRRRLIIAMYMLLGVFLVLFIRLFYLQIIQGPEYRRLSENNCIRLQSISPSRGLIFDRNGTLLVDNRPSFDLYVTLKDAGKPEAFVPVLSEITRMPAEEIFEKISRKKHPAYKPLCLLRDMDRDLLARVEVHRHELPGIDVSVRSVRHYIHGKSAAHVIGYLGEISAKELASGKYPETESGDTIGKFGVEKSFGHYLRGKHGGRQVEVTATGRVIRVLKTVPEVPGYNLYLTIDTALQKLAETLLAGKAGAAVAMDPNNGEILAMASSPSFDQNAFVDGMSADTWNSLIQNPERPLENKAIQAEYPPASTYKIITTMAALEEGVIDEKTDVFCAGHYQFGDRTFRDWRKGGHGHVNVLSALARSCDVFFYQVGLKLGVDRLAFYAKSSGLGNVTGISLGNEGRGLVPTAAWKKKRIGENWQPGETLSIAIGQGYNLATPLQILQMISAVANGGKRYRPIIVNRIETADGRLIREAVTEVTGHLPVSPATLNIVKEGLKMVVESPIGTAHRVKIDGISMSGKTGTAQVVGRSADDDESYPDHLKPHAWFAAYAPSDNSEIAVVVIVEHGEHGSSTAAPIASRMIAAYLGNRMP